MIMLQKMLQDFDFCVTVVFMALVMILGFLGMCYMIYEMYKTNNKTNNKTDNKGMSKILVFCLYFVCVMIACVFISAGKVENAVYTVENGVYYHKHGDCAVCEKSHDHTRKIYITSKTAAEAKLYMPCRKCCK